MVRFVDLGKQLGPGIGADEEWPREFAFYDTITDRFLEIGEDQVFESWEELAESLKYGGLSPIDQVRLHRRLWRISPDWVKAKVV